MEKVISTGRRSRKIRGRRGTLNEARRETMEKRGRRMKKKMDIFHSREIFFKFRVSSREISNDSAKYTYRGERFRCSRRIIQAAAS